MSSRTYSQHQASNRNKDKQVFKKARGVGGGRQSKPRDKEALHSPTVASKAVLTRIGSNNTTSVPHRTPQRHALYIHPWSTSYFHGIAQTALDSSLIFLPKIFQWEFRGRLYFLASVTFNFQLIFVSFFSTGIQLRVMYKNLPVFQLAWHEVREDKPKLGKVLGV